MTCISVSAVADMHLFSLPDVHERLIRLCKDERKVGFHRRRTRTLQNEPDRALQLRVGNCKGCKKIFSPELTLSVSGIVRLTE
jgi:hypothetical protein